MQLQRLMLTKASSHPREGRTLHISHAVKSVCSGLFWCLLQKLFELKLRSALHLYERPLSIVFLLRLNFDYERISSIWYENDVGLFLAKHYSV